MGSFYGMSANKIKGIKGLENITFVTALKEMVLKEFSCTAKNLG